MRLVTYEEPYYRRERLGIWIGQEADAGHVVDANYAYARMLKDEDGDDYPQLLAGGSVPPSLVMILRGGKKSMDALRKVEPLSVESGPSRLKGSNDEQASFQFSKVR